MSIPEIRSGLGGGGSGPKQGPSHDIEPEALGVVLELLQAAAHGPREDPVKERCVGGGTHTGFRMAEKREHKLHRSYSKINCQLIKSKIFFPCANFPRWDEHASSPAETSPVTGVFRNTLWVQERRWHLFII